MIHNSKLDFITNSSIYQLQLPISDLPDTMFMLGYQLLPNIFMNWKLVYYGYWTRWLRIQGQILSYIIGSTTYSVRFKSVRTPSLWFVTSHFPIFQWTENLSFGVIWAAESDSKLRIQTRSLEVLPTAFDFRPSGHQVYAWLTATTKYYKELKTCDLVLFESLIQNPSSDSILVFCKYYL